MTYTRAWSSTTPLGTRAAKEIDDSSREKSVDIQERINSILSTGSTIDTDPLAINPARVGNSTPVMTRYIVIPTQSARDGIGASGLAYASQLGSGELDVSVVVPVGYKITLFEAYMDRNTAPDVTARLLGFTMNDGAGVLDTGALTRAVASIGIVTSGALNRTVTNLDTFTLKFSSTGSSLTQYRIYGARITVEVPNLSFGY